MPNRKLIQQTLLPASFALGWATLASANNSTAVLDDGNLTILAIAGTILLLVALLVWRLLSSRGEKKSDPAAAFMTLEQITRLESPGNASTLMKVAQPKAMPTQAQGKPAGAKKPASPSDAHMSDLEKQYPRIVEKLETMWIDPECESYLQSLTFDDRGDREGFSREVSADIMMLYGVKLKERGDFWS